MAKAVIITREQKIKDKLNELEVQQEIVNKVADLIESLERDKNYALTTYDKVVLTDEEGEPILDENGKEKYEWQNRPYTEEELAECPSALRKVSAYDQIIEALEDLI